MNAGEKQGHGEGRERTEGIGAELEAGPLVTEVLSEDTLRADPDWWRIYAKSFPPEELEPPEVIYRSIERREGVVLRARQGEETVGIAACHLLTEVPAVFCTYIGIDPGLRSRGLGGPLFDALYRAGEAGLTARGLESIGFVWEVDGLEDAKPSEIEIRKRRIAFYERQGGQMLPCPYMQPPIDGTTYVPMRIMFRPAPGRALPDCQVQRTLVHAIYFEKYRNANRIPDSILDPLFASLYAGAEEP